MYLQCMVLSVDDVSFELKFIDTEIDNSNIPTGINLQVDSSGILIGDTISLESQLIDGTSGQSIQIDVQDPSGNIVVLQSLTLMIQAQFHYHLRLKRLGNLEHILFLLGIIPIMGLSTSETIQILRRYLKLLLPQL